MATGITAPTIAPLTYEAYMAEQQIEGRYDITNGVRIFLPGATWRNQRLVVEFISDSETRRILGDKAADYGSIGVDEA